ncbi:hypothetical protein Tco_0886865 [Tanacetum coccineum]
MIIARTTTNRCFVIEDKSRTSVSKIGVNVSVVMHSLTHSLRRSCARKQSALAFSGILLGFCTSEIQHVNLTTKNEDSKTVVADGAGAKPDKKKDNKKKALGKGMTVLMQFIKDRLQGFTSFMRKDCILEAIVASSTDNYPLESIYHTLEPGDRVDLRASYWSSDGDCQFVCDY